jgi:glycosyltransferase involved in cell wall biosynthesis
MGKFFKKTDRNYTSSPNNGSSNINPENSAKEEVRKPQEDTRRRDYRNTDNNPRNSTSSVNTGLNDPKKEIVNREDTRRPQEDTRRRDNRPPEHIHHMNNINVSVVIPLFNEEESLKELAEQIHNVLARERLNYEVIFIDDGSTDSSLQKIKEINRINRRFKCFSFRRNYGKSAALNLGFKKARGEYIITMDADLQDDPKEIPNLLRKMKEGYDVVSGWKKERHDPFIKNVTSKFYNFFTRLMSGIKIHDFNCGLKAYRRDVCKDVNIYGELHRYIPVLAKQYGYRISEVAVQHHKRKYGKTKYGLNRFIRGPLDLLTIIFNTNFGTRPLHFFGGLGTIAFLAGFGINLYLTFLWYFQGIWLGGRPLLFLGVLLIILGIQFFSVGLLGEMITRTSAKQEEPNLKDVVK